MSGSSGKYRLETRLGGGGMAEVFVGSTVGAEGFTRRVAIKRVLAGFSDNPAFAQMFVAEAQITSRLQHPNIVSVLDFDRDPDGRLFLVMELVEGKDLDALISAGGQLPFAVVIHVISEVLRGLGYAHNLPSSDDAMRGLIHRDVSPHNVLVSWEGAVKVSDFGIAKARAASNATASVFIKGKPQYMSPEQANGLPLDGRSDLFAVGVMLWEMLTGARLFVGNTTQEVLARMLFSPIRWPRELRPEVPVDLERIAMRLLERNLAARYATAEDAVDDLLACRDAPRGGRDELVKALVDRFPGVAPSRPVRRAMSAPAAAYHSGETRSYAGAVPITAPPGYISSPTATTARGGATPSYDAQPAIPTPVPAAPGMPAMSAETRTVTPQAPRARLPLAVWLVGGGVLALLVTLIALTLGRDKAGGGGGSGSAVAMAPAGSAGSGLAAAAPVDAPAAPVALPPDAAPAPAPAPVVDAAPSTTVSSSSSSSSGRHHKDRPDGRDRPDARVATTPPSPPPSRDGCSFERNAAKGTIKITGSPWAIVTIDGVKQSQQAPTSVAVPAGCHKVRLENDEYGKDESRNVEVEAGKTKTISFKWD